MTIQKTLFMGAVCTLATWGVFAGALDTRRWVTDPETGAVTMWANGTNLWTYVPQSREGKPYFHPLTIPGTGEALTAFRPPDHAWHLGFWFSWKLINGYNFWEPNSNAVTRVLAQSVVPGTDNVLTVEATLAYVGDGRELVRENRKVRVSTAENGQYVIDWESAFTAQDTAVEFSATPVKRGKDGNWAAGGYAGLMWRLPDQSAFGYQFKNAAGQTNVKACGEPSDWVEVVATSKVSGARAKITLRDHADNPRHPTPWFVRYDVNAHKGRGYFLAGPAMVFYEPLRLAAGETARFRYSLSVESQP